MGDVDYKTKSVLIFYVNGKKVVDEKVDPEWTLLYYLRNKLRLTGTKLGCAEGGCGACTVMASKYDRSLHKVIHYSLNACLAPVCSVHGLAITTVEGIGSTKSCLHPVQERIAKAHGSQCGFCTPGIVMSMYTLLRSLPGKPTMEDVELAFQGNLCRCTGYRPILEGYRSFTEEWEQQQRSNGVVNGVCSLGDRCCRNSNASTQSDTNCIIDEQSEILFDSSEFKPYDPSQEPIFPPELQVSDCLDCQFLVFKGPRVTWYRPTTLEQLINLKSKYLSAKLVNGNTEIGVEVKFKNCFCPILIHPDHVKELTEITITDEGVNVGASVTLTNLENILKEEVKKQPEHRVQIFKAIIDMLHWFAGKQIRNVAAIGGNIMTGSPISDLNPIFMSSKCQLEFISAGGHRKLLMDSSFWTGYRRNITRPDEILLFITIPYTIQNQHFLAYKQSKRREDDIAIVNAAFNLQLDSGCIKFLDMAFGGMAPTTVMTPKTSKKLIGKPWTSATLEEACGSLAEELTIDPGAPGGLEQYRQSLSLSLFFKFFVAVNENLEKENCAVEKLPETYKSASQGFRSLPKKSSQYFQIVPSTQEKNDLVGKPIVHLSAFKQAAGEALYCDDMPFTEGELYLCLVLSTRAHAKIVRLDPSEALTLPGVHAFFSAKDLPGDRNYYGPVIHDDLVFAKDEVTCHGQVIGAIVADNQQIAHQAKKHVKVEYEDLHPVIITMEDAIRENSFYGQAPKILKFGNAEAAFSKAEHVITGEIRIAGQEHFYLETQAAIAIPKGEDDEMEIIVSSQHPTEIQFQAAQMLGIPSNRVVCKIKRIGGGFGGKESRSSPLALAAALAAHCLGKPVRGMFDRDEDMTITGQRHPFLAKYKLAFTKEGKITACEIFLYTNAGNSTDLSMSVMDRAIFHFENAYRIPNVTCYGYVCKTNLPTNTAFRGFGGPQAMFIGESMIHHVATYLGVDVFEVSRLNLYKEGDLTHFNQELTYCTLERCWEECVNSSEYHKRKAEIEQFNRKNRWHKRGISVVPTMYGIAFTSLFLNQAGALVLIYADGSVLISHSGIEMGQGLHTKMIQVASRALEIPASLIHIADTRTDKVPNTSPSAASSGSDLNGMAILNACSILLERLKPYKAANPKGEWKDWVKAAFFDRVSLAASGFYKTPDLGYNFQTNSGRAFNYFCYGVGCSEVEIDCLTGDHQVRRTDIVMDVGESINPAIDVGQIEGAFMQGYGLFVLEEPLISPDGVLYTKGPGTYKLPGFADIPAVFNVSLLKGAPNPRAVYSSKAVGEPPLFLSSSVFFAIREAIKSARHDSGKLEYFQLNSPATSARIRMACVDSITEKFQELPANTYRPWTVEP